MLDSSTTFISVTADSIRATHEYLYRFIVVRQPQFKKKNIHIFTHMFGDRGGTEVKVLCYKSEGR